MVSYLPGWQAENKQNARGIPRNKVDSDSGSGREIVSREDVMVVLTKPKHKVPFGKLRAGSPVRSALPNFGRDDSIVMGEDGSPLYWARARQ